MKQSAISASMMCIDFTEMKSQIEQLNRAQIDYFHIDVMDGHFVPNLMLCSDIVNAMRALTTIPFDYHFMVEQPNSIMPLFDIRQGDIVSIHVEGNWHLQKSLQYAKQKGAGFFVATNPGTSLSLIDAVVDEIDGILVMTVNPGFAGQKLVANTLSKITAARQLLDSRGKYDCSVQVDGNVSFPNACLMRKYGADIFVAGSSSVFQKEFSIAEGVEKLRRAIKQGETDE